MRDEDLQEIESIITEAVESVFEDRMEELEDNLRDVIEEAVNDAIEDYFPGGIEEFLLGQREGDGLQPIKRTRVMSPDKSKVLVCIGGLKVDGKTLVIQTGINSWQSLCWFETEEEALEALKKVSDAIEAGVSLIEL